MTYSIFTTQTPSAQASSTGFILGTAFTLAGIRSCTAGRYYTDSTRVGDTVQIGLWTAAGTLLASGSRTQVSGDSGWITVPWDTPVNITGSCIVGYLVPNGESYQRTASGLTSGLTSGPFTVPATGGRFIAGSALAVPTSTSTNNYFVDVVVGEDIAGYLPAPRYAEMGPHRTANVIGKGTGAAPPKTTGQIWPRGKR